MAASYDVQKYLLDRADIQDTVIRTVRDDDDESFDGGR